MFLLDMLDYYTTDVNRRAITENGFCRYKTNDNKSCAIGRFISNKDYKTEIEGKSVSCEEVKKLIPKELCNLSFEFLRDIQFLHDASKNWHENGLTERGKHKIIIIINNYSLNALDFEKYTT